MDRNRILYAIIIAITISLGLASRYFSEILPHWTQRYLGDVLWALMVFWGIGFIFKNKTTLWIAVLAFVFSLCIEFSQLYHAGWIDTIRATRIGGLVLGFGFLWSDLVCYFIGIGFGFLLEKTVMQINSFEAK